MTEEEKAEEYAHKSMAWCEDFDFTYKVAEEKIKQAYLAGLHEGQPKWHKVADGDLPPKKKPVLCYLFNEYYILAFLREDNVWTTNNHNAFENVRAWCEIPIFDKE